MIKNSKEWPNVYSCNFLEAGIVSYKDSDAGIALLSKEAMDKMAPSFIGKPVVINHQDINPNNYDNLKKEGVIVGSVIRCWFNPADGWYWADFMVDSDQARERIDKFKDKVSCAYTVLDAKEGGLWHDIPYDMEITDGAYTHLALVAQPRYEGSKITQQLPAMLVNGKAAFYINNKEDNDMKFDFSKLKIFKKGTEGKEELADPVVLVNGKEFLLSDFLEVIQEKANSMGNLQKQGTRANDTDIVDINGHSYSIADLVKNMKEKLDNEKKNCDCTPKDGMHAENCPCYKSNEKTDAQDPKDKGEKGKKSDAEKEADQEKEKTNTKAKADAEEKQALVLENARLQEEKKKKEDTEFFNALNNISETVIEERPAEAAFTTRKERANRKKEQISRQFA